jgi:thiol-disulfide isomerase/thioredoxin
MTMMRSPVQRVLAALVCVGGACTAAPGQAHEPDAGAVKAFEEIVAAYRKRPALDVETTIKIEVRQGDAVSKEREVKAAFTLGQDRTGLVKIRGFTVYVGGGKLSAVHESTDHSYFTTPDAGSPYYALMNVFIEIPFPHLAIAFGEPDIGDLCMQFHQTAPWVQPTAVDTVTMDDRLLGRLKLTSDYDDMQVLYDPKTKLIESVDLEVTGGDFVQGGASLRYRHTFKYTTHDAPLPKSALAFDPGPRQRVDMMQALVARPVAPEPAEMPEALEPDEKLVGNAAPDFALATLDGGAVDLAALRGRVVVLDFWATWCGPCKTALPLLHEVARWAKEQDLPVEVLTVNVWDRGEPDWRRKNVGKFWKEKGFTLPVVMDYTNQTATAYRLTGIPATVVIRADGVIHTFHTGVGGDYVATLRGDITGAIEALEAD